MTDKPISPEVLREAERHTFQVRVHPWLLKCFGAEIATDRIERGDRFLEEVLELLQSGGYDPARVLALRDYVWSRPVGEPSQEAGGVMVTLAAYCLAHSLDMHAAGETELARINAPEIVAKIRSKQAAKPTGSALPIAVKGQTISDDERAKVRAAALEEAAKVADWALCRASGYSPVTARAPRQDQSAEIAKAIRSLIDKPDNGEVE